MRTSIELRVVDIDTSVDDIYINALTSVCYIVVLCERAKSQFLTVTDSSETLLRKYIKR